MQYFADSLVVMMDRGVSIGVVWGIQVGFLGEEVNESHRLP